MSTLSMRSMVGLQWGSSLKSSESFPSPFLDMASLAMPTDISTVLQWCEFIFQSNGTYRMAMERVIAYFITDVELGATSTKRSLGDDEKEKWEEFLNDQLGIKSVVQALDRDLACYGNSFVSVVVPIKRFLICPKNGCHVMFSLKTVYENNKFRFDFKNFEFLATCPKCGNRGSWIVHDQPDNTPERLSVKRWSPHEIKLLHDPLTERVQYLWEIPEDYKRIIREGKLFHLEQVSKEVLDAIKKNQLFKFADDVIYHMKEPTLAGVINRGWGISRILANFRLLWYVQVLHRFNESIALDYVIPFRLITPASRGGSNQAGGQARDPLLTYNMGDHMSQIRHMLRQRRKNPAGWHTLAFPVEYQALGGDAQQLAPKDLLDQGIDTMLTAAGVPVQLYKGDLQLQSAPVAMRLFEATWAHLVQQNNNFLKWLVERVSEILSWEAVDARHRRVQHADDMQRHMAILQLMMGGVISQTNAFRSLGLDFQDEKRLIAQEAMFEQQQQSEVQKQMQQADFAAQMAVGMPQQGQAVDPATGQPIVGPVSSMLMSQNTPQTPEDMISQANSIAQQLLGLPEAQKDSELRTLKQTNEVLHSLVRMELEKIRGKARSQGGAQMIQQQFSGTGNAGSILAPM